MGNVPGTDQPEQMERARFTKENSELTRAHSPSPSQIDLSHLSSDERVQIKSVLMRHLSLERKEHARIEMLRKEMNDFERSVSAASSSAHGISDGLCAICRTAPLLEDNGLELMTGGSGERCDSCGRVCCLNCGQLRTSKTTKDELWVCLVCEKRYEFIMKSGLWFNLKDECPTVAHFGLHLHDKPASDTSSRRQPLLGSSSEILPSIVVTQPSVKGRKKKMVFHEPDEVGITAPCSSDSDECGGFTPPEDNLNSPRQGLSVIAENDPSSQETDKANGSGHTKRPLQRSLKEPYQLDPVVKSEEEKTWSSSLDKTITSQSATPNDDSLFRKQQATPLLTPQGKKSLTSISSRKKRKKSKKSPDINADGQHTGEKVLPSQASQHERSRTKTSGEIEKMKKKENWKSSGKRKLPKVPLLPKPWTSPQAAAAARQQKQQKGTSSKSTVDRMQPGEKPFPVHLADLDISVDKGAELSNEKVSQMLKTNESLYAVTGCHLNTNEELSLEKESMNMDMRERSDSVVSYETESCHDPNYARIGPGFIQPLHHDTPTAKETEPGYASVESAAKSQLIVKETTQGYVSDVSLGEITGLGYERVGNEVSLEHQNEQTLEAENDEVDTLSLGEISEPGYARVKISTVEQDANGESEMAVVMDDDDDDDVGYSRIGIGQSKQRVPQVSSSSSDDDTPDPGYQRIADVKKQLVAVSTSEEVDALYAKVEKNDKKGKVPVTDPSSLYGKVVKAKVQDPSALYSAVKKIKDASLLNSTVDKQKGSEDGSDRSGMRNAGVSSPTALYASVDKPKQKQKSFSSHEEKKERKQRQKEASSLEEKKERRQLPRAPSSDVDSDSISLKERKAIMEKKLFQTSSGQEDSTEDMIKSRAIPNDIPSSQYGLVRKRMAFFTQQSSDNDIVVKKPRRPGQIGIQTSVSSGADSESSETPASTRTSVSSPSLTNIRPSSLSSTDSFSKEKPTSLLSLSQQSDGKSAVGRVCRFKDHETGSPLLSRGKEQVRGRADDLKDKSASVMSPTEQSVAKSPVSAIDQFKESISLTSLRGKEQKLDRAGNDKPASLKSPTEQSVSKSPVGKVQPSKDTVTFLSVQSMEKEQELNRADSSDREKPASLKSSAEQSISKSPVGQVRRFKDTVASSPGWSVGKEQEMQNTLCKGKPPVSPTSSDEIVTVFLQKEEQESNMDSPPFGLKIETRPGGHKLYVVEIITGSLAMQCPKIAVGDEVMSVDGRCYGNSTRGAGALVDHLVKADCVKLKLRKRSKQGAEFKKKVKEKQLQQSNDKFSLAESLRLSGSDVSLNSRESTPERQRQRIAPVDVQKDANHTQNILERPAVGTDDSVVRQLAHPVTNGEPSSVKNTIREQTPALSSEDTDEAVNEEMDSETGTQEAQVKMTNHGVVGDTKDPTTVLRDKGKKKKLTFWQRFSAVVTSKKGHLVGSVDDLQEVPNSGTFHGRRVGSVGCLLDDSRPSRLDRSVGTSTSTMSSSGSSGSSGSVGTVPSSPLISSDQSPKRSLLLSSPLSQPAAPMQQSDLKLGKGQTLKLGVIGPGSSLEDVGIVHLSVMYVGNKMTVEIIEARNLDGQNRPNAKIPYVKVCLMSSSTHKKIAKQKTKPAKRSADPAFYERLFFTQSNVQHRYLKVMVCRRERSSIFAKRHCIGEAVISLDELDLSSKVDGWYKLFAESSQKTETPLPTSSRTMQS